MTDNIKAVVAQNLTDLRKEENLTQTALAKILNYSDKAVSKWECGDSLPDIATLCRLAEFYGVTLDYLVSENPEEKGKRTKGKPKIYETRGNRIVIAGMAVVVMFLVATLVFVYELMSGRDLFGWRVFVLAVPCSCIILQYFFRQWKSARIFRFVSQSVLCWSLVTFVYLQVFAYKFWYIFLLGIPVQILIILSYALKTK